MLKIEQLCVRHRLRDVSVAQAGGKVVHIIGQNGAGKSSLLSSISGVLNIDDGSIWVNEQLTSHIDEVSFSLFRAYLEQQQDTPFHLPVEQVLRYFSHDEKSVSCIPSMLNEAVELTALLHRSINQLSGGERQRVHIARSLLKAWPKLMQGNGLVLLDEPFQGLDYRHQRLLCEFLAQLAEKGNCILVSVHDVNLSVSFADDVWLMHEGRLVLAGSKQEVLTQANLSRYWQVDLRRIANSNGLNYFYLAR